MWVVNDKNKQNSWNLRSCRQEQVLEKAVQVVRTLTRQPVCICAFPDTCTIYILSLRIPSTKWSLKEQGRYISLKLTFNFLYAFQSRILLSCVICFSLPLKVSGSRCCLIHCYYYLQPALSTSASLSFPFFLKTNHDILKTWLCQLPYYSLIFLFCIQSQ